MERYCKYCGAQLPPSGNFCGKCGMPVGSGEDMFGSAEPTVDSYHYGDMNSGRGAAPAALSDPDRKSRAMERPCCLLWLQAWSCWLAWRWRSS